MCFIIIENVIMPCVLMKILQNSIKIEYIFERLLTNSLNHFAMIQF